MKKTIIAISLCLLSGLSFAGWYDNPMLSDGDETDFSELLNEDKQIYARWGDIYSVKKEWNTEQNAALPEEVSAVLQHNANGTWTTVETVQLNAGNHWQANFAPVNHENGETYRVRELDRDGNIVPDSADDDVGSTGSAIFDVDEDPTGYETTYRTVERQFIIINSTVKTYSVDLGWDIDRGDQDRPGEIEAVLQRQESKFSWTSLEIVKLNPANGWRGEYDPVPIGYVNDTDTYVRYSYRIRLDSFEFSLDALAEQSVFHLVSPGVTLYKKDDFRELSGRVVEK